MKDFSSKKFIRFRRVYRLLILIQCNQHFSLAKAYCNLLEQGMRTYIEAEELANKCEQLFNLNIQPEDFLLSNEK